MLQQVLIVEALSWEILLILYCLQVSSWGGAEAASIKILDQLCFRFVSCYDCMSVMSQRS